MNNVQRLNARFKKIQLSKIRGLTRELAAYENKRQNCIRYTENLLSGPKHTSHYIIYQVERDFAP